jgi:hypothetical protein
MLRSIVTLLLAALPLAAQQITFPPAFEKLAAKASETVNVTLDTSLLGFAGKFLSDKDPEEAAAKKLLGGLKGIYVRGFEFAKEGEYSSADVEAIREQLKGPDWACFLSVQSKRETTEICLHREGDAITGLALLAAEPRELTVVNIVGAIRPEDLAALSGHFGLPQIKGEVKTLLERKTAPAPKKDE